MNDDNEKYSEGGPPILKNDEAMELLLDAEGGGSEDELIDAPRKRVDINSMFCSRRV